MNIPEFLKSSSGEGVALRWRSAAMAVVPVLVILANLAGYNITQEVFGEFVNLIADLILGIWFVASLLLHIKGWAERNFRKRNKLGAFSKS